MIERRFADKYIVKLLKMSVFLEINVTALRYRIPAPGDNVSSVENEAYRSKGVPNQTAHATGVTVVACFRVCISFLKNRDLTWFPSYLLENYSFKPDFSELILYL